jgi:hypothetical protein
MAILAYFTDEYGPTAPRILLKVAADARGFVLAGIQICPRRGSGLFNPTVLSLSLLWLTRVLLFAIPDASCLLSAIALVLNSSRPGGTTRANLAGFRTFSASTFSAG